MATIINNISIKCVYTRIFLFIYSHAICVTCAIYIYVRGREKEIYCVYREIPSARETNPLWSIRISSRIAAVKLYYIDLYIIYYTFEYSYIYIII